MIVLWAGACAAEATTPATRPAIDEPVGLTPPPPTEQDKPNSTEPASESLKRQPPTSDSTGGQVGEKETIRRLAAMLVTQIKDGKFPHDERKKIENANAFLYLAETSTKPPLVAAALGALATVFHANHVAGKRRVFSRYHRVVLKHLNNKNPAIFLAAFQAAKHSIKTTPPDNAVMNRLVEIATTHKHPAAKLRALNSLRTSRGLSEPVQRSFLTALDSKDKFLIVGALNNIEGLGDKFVQSDAFENKLLALIASPSEQVRGAAARALARPASLSRARKTRRAEALLALLKDKSPHVRSSVLDSLGRLQHFPSIKVLMAQIDNTEPDKLTLSFADVDGSPEKLYLRVSAGGSVGSSAMFGLTMMTIGTPIELEYKPIANIGETKRAATEVRAWYAANRNAIKKLVASQI